MLYIGIIFILLGLYCIFQDYYDMSVLIKERVFVKNKQFVVDDYFKIKLVLGVFAIVVGVLSIVNYIIY